MAPSVLNQSAAFAVLAKDSERHDRDIAALQIDVVGIRVVIAALAAKVAIYAALGATIGGAVVGAIVTLILN